MSWGLLLLLCLALCSQARHVGARQSFSFQLTFREHRARGRRLAQGANYTVPLLGGVPSLGYFFVNIGLGTPAQPFSVIVDTGSTRSYVHCISCGSNCGPNKLNEPFDPAASSTYAAIGCSAPACACGSTCGCSSGTCTYNVSYLEESTSSGNLIQDVLSIGDQPAGNLTFGCETKETGLILMQTADGLVGLGNSSVSLVGQLAAAGAIDRVFSLCMAGGSSTGALLLGNATLPAEVVLQYTPSLYSPSYASRYLVNLTGLAVDGKALALDAGLFQQGFGTVLDSGATFTYLPTPAYDAFVKAVEAKALAAGLSRVNVAGQGQSQNLCYGTQPASIILPSDLSKFFPTVALALQGVDPLVLPPSNYLFPAATSRTTSGSPAYCLSLVDNADQGTILGNNLMTGVLVQYDLQNRRIGFGAANCTALAAPTSAS